MRVRLPSSRPTLVTLLIALASAVYWAWAISDGLQKFPPEKRQLVETGHSAVEVELAFPPEAFHQAVLATAGRVVQVRGRSVFLRNAKVAELAMLAQRYWVVDIRISN